MTDERIGTATGAWLRDRDRLPVGPQSSLQRTMAEIQGVPQVRRSSLPAFLTREPVPVGSLSTTRLDPGSDHPTNGRQPIPVAAQTGGSRTMFTTPRLIVAGASFALIGGILLSGALVSPAPAGPGAEVSGAPAPAGVGWATERVNLVADDFILDVNDLTFGEDVWPTGVVSDPGSTDYWTLEIEWQEHGVEQRLNMYFGSDGTDWWVDEIRTYDGYKRGEWVYAYGPFFQTPLGETFEGDVQLDLLGVGRPQDDGNRVPAALSFDGLRLSVSPGDRKPSSGSVPSAVQTGTRARLSVQLAGATIVGDEAAEGVLKIVDDETNHGLENVIDVVVTTEGEVWAATKSRIFELGVPGALKGIDGGPKSIAYLDAGANGQLLIEADEGGWLTSDGETWNTELSDQWVDADTPSVAADGSYWGFTREGVGRLDPDGWTIHPMSEVFPVASETNPALVEEFSGGGTVTTPDGTIWAAATMDGSISRFDGQSWQEFRPLGGDGTGTYRVLDLAAGDDGTVWALMTDMKDEYLAWYDGAEWSTFLWDEVIDEPAGLPNEIGTVSGDGTLYLAVSDSTANRTASILAFDGETATVMPALPEDEEEDFEQLAVLPSGEVLAAGRRGLYVFIPDGR